MEAAAAANVDTAVSPDSRRLELEDVYKVFVTKAGRKRLPLTAVKGVSLAVEPGEFLTLLGPSGCGKSTVLNMLAGLDRPSSGTVRQGEVKIDSINTRVSYLTQDDNLLPWRTLLHNVELPLEITGAARKERRERALELLARVGLKGFEEHYPHQLSGGMRKRGSIVRALLSEKPVILMDEPFGPLDAQTRLLLQDQLLRLWQGSGRTIVFITHDIVEAISLSDRIAIFSARPGRIKQLVEVPIPRPRDVFHIHHAPEFGRVHDLVWESLREELAGPEVEEGRG